MMNINRPAGLAPQTPVRFGQFKVQLHGSLTPDEKDAIKPLFRRTSTPRMLISKEGFLDILSSPAKKLYQLYEEGAGNQYSVQQRMQALEKFCKENNIHPMKLLDLQNEIAEVSQANMSPVERCQVALMALEEMLKACFPKEKPTLWFEKFADECIQVTAVDKEGQALKICDLPGMARSIPKNSKVLLYDKHKPESMQDDLRRSLTGFAEGLNKGILEGLFKKPSVVPFAMRISPQPGFDPSKE
ncbi:MAG TPA: hypothetical protein V6C52_08830 [Coleofasciculaceae cyanobacterium]|jgi:hypothetical protein